MAPKILKRWAIIATSLLIAGMFVINILAYRHAHAMMYFAKNGERTSKPEKLGFIEKAAVLFTGITLPRPTTTHLPLDLHPDCKSVTIEQSEKVRLGAWYCTTSEDSSLVILFHGYGGEKSCTIREAKAFLELGHSVLLVDFRGSGESSEAYTTIGFDEADDVAAAMRHAREHLPHKTVLLYGQSMGAAAIFRAVHSCGVRPDGIISEAVFDTLLNTVRHRFDAMGVPSFPSAELLVFWGGQQAGFNGFSHNPADYARKVDCPILFLHGSNDPRAQIADARRVFDAAGGQKRFHEFPNLGHEPALVRFPEQWKGVVKDWMDSAIPNPGRGVSSANPDAKPKSK